MASHSSTNSYLRSSVYDAALDLGLADPKLAMWLEEIPESPVADVKSNTNYPSYGGPTSSSSHAMGLSSPESDFSHSSNTTVITSPSLSSHDGTPFYTFAQASGSHKGPPRGRFDRPELESFLRAEVIVTKSPPPPQQPTSSMAPPPTKASKKAAKLLKKQRPSDPTKSAKSSIDRERPSRDKNASEDFNMDSRDRFAFLKDEPVNLAQDKESRSFFGRLRDRSRSKSRVGKEDKRGGDVSARASDEATQTPTETRGRTVTVTVKGGAPQLQLEPRNRDSADLLSSMNFGVSTASSPPNTFFVSQPQPLPTPTYIEPASPPPHVGPVMDRPHPKVRTSGYWGNKDRGTVVPTARATTFRAGGGSMARRGSHHRKGSSSRGLRKVPSGRRPRPAAGARASRLSTASTLTLQVLQEPDGAHEVSEDIDPIVEAIDKYRGMSFMSTPSTPGMSEEPQAKTPEQATPIPVIIERKPSTKSTNRSIPPLSLKIDPRLMGVSRPLASPLRSPSSTRSPRHSRHSNLPSPLKPPTSPLPPTPTLSPPPNRTGNRTLRPPSAQPASSDWFDDDGSSDNRSVTPMSPLFPREDYVVASPGASAGTFPVTTPDLAVPSVGSSRPSAGRTALTPEGRARTLSIIGPSARTSQLRPGVDTRRPAEQGIPSSPKPTATIPPSASAKAVAASVPPRFTALRRSPSSSPSLKPPPIVLGPKFPTPSSSPKPLWRSPSSPSLSATGPSAMAPQRGRTSPFPTRPIGALSRSPSVVSLQQSDSGRSVKVEETKVDVDVRRKELAIKLSPTSGLLKRKESISELPRAMQVERYGNMPLRAFLPAAGKNFESKEIVVPRTTPRSIAGPSKADLPLMPRMASLRQQSSSKPPPSSQPPPKPPRSIARPPPSVNVVRASVASDVTTAPKPLIRQESLPTTQSRDSVWTRATQSVYSTVDGSGSDTEDEADDRFGLELDEEDADDDSLRGFDVIAAKFGKGRSSSKSPSRQNRLLQAIRADDDHVKPPTSPSNPTRSQDLLAVPPSPVDLPPASPSRPRATAGAGGSRWI